MIRLTGSIVNDALLQQASLRSLNLSHNVIGNVDAGAFRGLMQLQKLDLSHNKIVRLSERLFQGTFLVALVVGACRSHGVPRPSFLYLFCFVFF